MQEVTHANRRFVLRQFREIVPDVIVKCECPVLGEQDRAGRGELLCDGADIEDGPRRDRDPMIEVGQPVPA